MVPFLQGSCRFPVLTYWNRRGCRRRMEEAASPANVNPVPGR